MARMDIKTLCDEIDSLKGVLSKHRPLTQAELERLHEDFMIGFTYNSNAIEGNTMTLEETAIVIKEGITIGGKAVREHMEIIGHADAWRLVEDLVKESAPLTERMIFDIHHLVLMDRREDAGVYRRIPVYIRGSQAELPQPWQVPIEMERLISDYHGEMQNLHPVERAAVFHLRFESVHPFIDGNGRTGRLLMNLELMKEGFPPIDIKFTDRGRYIGCFKAWQGGGDDAAPMTLMAAEYMKDRLEEYLQILKLANEIRPNPKHGPTLTM